MTAEIRNCDFVVAEHEGELIGFPRFGFSCVGRDEVGDRP